MAEKPRQPSLPGTSAKPLKTHEADALRASLEFIPLSPVQPDPDAVGLKGQETDFAATTPEPPDKPLKPAVSALRALQVPTPDASTNPPPRKAKSMLGRSSSRKGEPPSPSPSPSPSGRPHSATPTSPYSPRSTRPVSAASTAASSRPSSAASRPPRSPSDFKLMLDFKAPPELQMQHVLQRRLSSAESSPRLSPRSPVTLLPHSPVARTPRSPLPSAGATMCGVPQLPQCFVERDAELLLLQSLLLSGNDVVLAGPKGLGGVGKSTLAAAIARDPEVQQTYRDGVFWIMMGPRVNPMIKAEELKVSMAMHRVKMPLWVPLDKTDTAESMRTWFQQNMQGRRCLLVVDNCREAAELEVFLDTGLRLLVTTLAAAPGTLLDSGKECLLPLVPADMAPAILAAAAGISEAVAADLCRKVLTSRFSGLPMELALIGGALKHLAQGSWDNALARVAAPGLNLEELYGSAAKAMDASLAQLLSVLSVSLEMMPPKLHALYRKLAVLPDCIHTPLHALQLLWDMQSEQQVKEVCRELASRSLMLVSGSEDTGEYNVTVHHIQLDFLRHKHPAEVAGWHAALVDAYSQGLDHIASVIDDGYIVNNIAHHLKGSQRLDTLRELLYDTDWLERKLHNHGIRAVLDDYLRYLEGRSDPQVHTLSRAFQMAAPAALAHPQLAMLGVQMAGRLMAHLNQPLIPDWVLFIRALLDEETYSNGAVPLWPLTPSLGQVAGGHLATLAGHSSWVNAVAISPDGLWAATCSTDRTTILWDLATGHSRNVLDGHTDHVAALGVSACGSRLATASRDTTARLWDSTTGEQVAVLEGHSGGINCCAVSGDFARGFVVTGADDATARTWDLSTGAHQLTLSGHQDKIRAVCVTDTGELIVTASDDRTARVWDCSSGGCRHVLGGHSDKVGGVVMVGGGRGGILTLSSDTTARLWDLQAGTCLHILAGHKGVVGGAAVTASATLAVTVSGDKTARVWNLATGACLHVLRGHTNWVNGVAIYGANGTTAITVSVDRHARIWDLTTGQCITTLEGHKSLVAGVAVSPDGSKALTVSSDMTSRLWSLQDGLSMYGCGHGSSKVSAVALLPDGERCVSVGLDGAAMLWDTATGLLCQVGLEVPDGLSKQITAVSVSGDGGSIAAAAGNDALVWDLGFLAQQPRFLHALRGHLAPVAAVALSHDGRTAVSGAADGTARVWDTAVGHTIAVLEGHRKAIVAVVVLSEGGTMGKGEGQVAAARPAEAIVTASLDGTARVWEPAGGRCAAVLIGHRAELTCCLEASSSSSQGSRATTEIITTSRDKTLRVWTPCSPESYVKGVIPSSSLSLCGGWSCRLELKGHSSPVTTATVVCCGAVLRAVSGSEDGSLLVWDLQTGIQLHTLEAHTAKVSVVSAGVCDSWQRRGSDHPAGALVLSCGEDACAALWDIATGCQVALFRGDAPLTCGALSTAMTQSGAATAAVGDVSGRLHFAQLPRR
mmetsp:Transcript_2071/g.6140  ORF Transcript_2071/g.6140 Transcript_2071/m.6140 type:complete len:1469 (+) Transcript_2071:718-5124(+)